MAGRTFGFLFMLVLVLVFGALFAVKLFGYAQIYVDGHRAKDWVAVPATIVDEGVTRASTKRAKTFRVHGTYRYDFAGKPYTSTRLVIERLASDSFFGAWNARLEGLAQSMQAARQSGATMTAYVNPSDPAEAVLDREAQVEPMDVLMFLILSCITVPFMIAPTHMLFRPSDAEGAALTARDAQDPAGGGRLIADTGSAGAWFMWILALGWNAFSFAAAFEFVPRAFDGGPWAYYLVAILPLIGLALLWGAIYESWVVWRRGRGALVLDPPQPRVGAPFRGVMLFQRRRPPGERYLATATWRCTRIKGGAGVEQPSGSMTAHSVTTSSGEGARLEFRIEIPESAQATNTDYVNNTQVRWSVNVSREPKPGMWSFVYLIDVLASDAPALPPTSPPPPAGSPGDALEAVRANTSKRVKQTLVATVMAQFAIGGIIYLALA